MDIKEVRRYNLIHLIDSKLKDKTFEFQEDFAKAVGIDKSYLSMMIMPPEKKGARGVSEKKARLIERNIGLPYQYLDSIENLNFSNFSYEIKNSLLNYPPSVYVAYYQEALCHNDHEEPHAGLWFTAEQLIQLGLSTQADDCAVLNVPNDSMSPKFNTKDLVLLDLKANKIDELRSGQVYAYKANNEIRISRIFKEVIGGLRFCSDNPLKTVYPDEVINSEQMQLVQLCGMVVWRGGQMY